MLRSLKLEQIHSVERVKHSGLIYTGGKQRSKDNVYHALYFEVLLWYSSYAVYGQVKGGGKGQAEGSH